MDASTLECLLLAEMKVHCFSNKQVAPAHLGLRRDILGVGTRGSVRLARVRHDQKRIGIIERGQDQSKALSRTISVHGGRRDVMLSGGGQQFCPSGDRWRRNG